MQRKKRKNGVLLVVFLVTWAAATGGVQQWGVLRGVWPPFLEIGFFLTFFHPFFSALFALFRRAPRAHVKSRKRRKEALFSSDIL